MMTGYISQKGQDQWVIEEVFQGKRSGYFVDLAATDGITDNNTYVLEQQYAWRGIAIEPNLDAFEALKRNRQCICDASVVDGRRGEVRFFANGDLGGIVADDTDNNPAVRGHLLRERQQDIHNRIAVTLEDILVKYDAPRVIDFLSLDVEGAEERILRTFPFNDYVFLSMSIERPTAALNQRLFAEGYQFVRKSQVLNNFDSFYVHRTCAHHGVRSEPFSETPRKDW